jgi:hypothetical protein|tara:strand:+ start:1192 stop:1368 length:177 start_codon:yes stop_codon:yes gene_type:complete
MLKIEQNENFKQFINIFFNDKLIDQQRTKAKAVKVATKFAKENDIKGFTFFGTAKLFS